MHFDVDLQSPALSFIKQLVKSSDEAHRLSDMIEAMSDEKQEDEEAGRHPTRGQRPAGEIYP
jgi:hypothetical protein